MRIFPLVLVIIEISFSSFFQQKKETSRDSLEILRTTTAGYLDKYNYHQGIESALQLLEASGEAESDKYLFYAHSMLGAAYEELEDSVRAKKNYAHAVDYAVKTQNDTLILWANNNLANVYSENPTTKEEGIEMYKKVIDLAEKTGMPEEGLAPQINIAWTYLDHDQAELAGPFLFKAREMLEKAEKKKYRPYLFTLFGRYFNQIKQTDSAETYFKKSLMLAERDSLILPASEVAKFYSDFLFEQERFEEAYKHLDKHQQYNSKIFESEKLEQVELANARFDVSEYQKDLELAKKEQIFQDQIIDKSREKVVVMVISSFVLVLILLILNKINQDRKRLIYELRVKNNQYKEAKENAERLSLLKSQFFSTVSHELRTPLYGVIGITSLLLKEKGLSKHRKDLNALKFSADYLLALINDVLQMNKMESNLVKLEKVNFNFQELMKDIINSFEYTRFQNENEIFCDIDEDIPANLIGDPVRLSQVLMNLVGNAMKFTERGTIFLFAKLEACQDGKAHIYFEVKDDGMGIPENKQKEIFEEFSQLRTRNYNYQGTGLGLPIVKKLLELFNSQIKLESAEGKGSKFSFSISFKINTEAGKNFQHDNGLEETGVVRRILVVDDNNINQIVTRRILEQKEFTCEVASGGEEAIGLVKINHYDLILMDVNMPGINGLEASMKIRKFNAEVPIIALTAVEIEEIRSKIFEAGMNDIIVKPYDAEQFYQIIYRNFHRKKVKVV